MISHRESNPRRSCLPSTNTRYCNNHRHSTWDLTFWGRNKCAAFWSWIQQRTAFPVDGTRRNEQPGHLLETWRPRTGVCRPHLHCRWPLHLLDSLAARNKDITRQVKCGLVHVYTGCPRRNLPYFGKVFLMLKYTDITQNTYIQRTVMEIMAKKVWNFDRYYTLVDHQIHIITGRNMWFL
jgi:hypothetical protein